MEVLIQGLLKILGQLMMEILMIFQRQILHPVSIFALFITELKHLTELFTE